MKIAAVKEALDRMTSDQLEQDFMILMADGTLVKPTLGTFHSVDPIKEKPAVAGLPPQQMILELS